MALLHAWAQILAEATEGWPPAQVEQFATLFEAFADDMRALATGGDFRLV
jgi:hypothetical protein